MNRKDQEKLQVWQERLALAENAIAGGAREDAPAGAAV